MNRDAILGLLVCLSGCASAAPAPLVPSPEKPQQTAGGSSAEKAIPATPGQPTAIQPTTVLLYSSDPKQKADPPPAVTFSATDEAAILRSLYGRFLSSKDDCGEPGSLEQARKTGQMTPRIVAALEGAFTQQGAHERLLLINLGECGATHADNWGSTRLVVLRGQQPVVDIESSGSALPAARDVNGDGMLDVVVESGFFNQGMLEASVGIITLAGGKVRDLAGFAETTSTTCGSMAEDGDTYAHVFVTTGPQPQFRVEKVEAPCAGE